MIKLSRQHWFYIIGGLLGVALISVPLFFGDLVASLLTERPVLSENNLVMDPYVTLENNSPWYVSIPDYDTFLDSKGIPTLRTGPTGLTISQPFVLPVESTPKSFQLRGQFGHPEPGRSFFITLRDNQDVVLYEEVQDPTDQFALDITIPPARRGFALSGSLSIELAPSTSYSNPWLELLVSN